MLGKPAPLFHYQPALQTKEKGHYSLISIRKQIHRKCCFRIREISCGRNGLHHYSREKTITYSPYPCRNLFIIPSHILLSNTDIELTTAIDHREARLKNEFDLIASSFEYVIIDCPPALSWLTINALTASDKVIVVVSPGYFELDSIVQISKTIREVREFFNPRLELMGFLFTMSDPTINTSTSLRILRQAYTDKVSRRLFPAIPI